ncbi:cytosine deaminase [Xenophilus azovorans]|uniref:cytosine deaminase n=1 Tax=Xenophilus azovorans TaxID=151755 RepID=UPI00056F1483|nr:cytosine deaminase [Xenophilus azovorans]
MTHAFFTPPAGGRYVLRNARAPRCLVDDPLAADLRPAGDGDLVALDLAVEDGRIAAIAPAGATDAARGPDMDASLVLPGFVDLHTHLDKGHIWPRRQNPTGDGAGAALATMQDRTAHWHAEDVRRRMDFALRTAYAKGVVAIRTHLDSLAPQAQISFPVFRAMREAWAGRIDLQASSIAPVDIFLTDEGVQLADIVAESGGNLGCVTRSLRHPAEPTPPEVDEGLARLLRLAAERGLDVDLHVDESTDPRARSLIRVARAALAQGFKGRILCGHCTSLALQTDEFIAETLAACRDAGIAVVSLPTVNMYLQDRSREAVRTPRWRGVTVLHEMKAAGLDVAVAGDNCRDPFYAYGDHDMLDTYTQAVKILHLDHPFADWIRAASATPAAIMGLQGRGVLKAGMPADLMVLRARSYSEMLARHQFDRTVLRRGRAIDTTLPDYRELDELVEGRH